MNCSELLQLEGRCGEGKAGELVVLLWPMLGPGMMVRQAGLLVLERKLSAWQFFPRWPGPLPPRGLDRLILIGPT